jgi:class 3 adenylate cyclase/tetratricopeptide (TPR) repeat protein
MDGQVTCSACGADNVADARFCGSCGAALGRVCPVCGQRNPADGRFCTSCGEALAAGAGAALGTREAFMPPALADKLRAGSVSIEGERKLITVLFADVAGYTAMSEQLDPEEMRALMQRAFGSMLDAIHRFEGTVAQLQGDGLLALFGAPIAHEDHAIRAIRAGLAVHEGLTALRAELAMREIDFRVRVGVHSGLVVFGRIGTDLEFTFQAVGDTVNTASRVQGLAEPGTVVMSEATHRLAAGYFVFDDLGSHTVKNKAEPVHVFRAIRATGSRSRVDISAQHGLGPYVGRTDELETLARLFDQADAGDGQVVFLSGEAGLGKSRLVHEFRERLIDRDHLWLLGRCISYGADIPYGPIVDLLRSAADIEETDAEEVMDAKLTTKVEALGAAAVHLPYLRFLLSLDPRDPAVLDEDPMLRKPRVFEAFRDVVLASAIDRPAVLVIEDLHWVDQASTELVSFVLESVPDHRIVVVLTHRPEWVHPFGQRAFHTSLALAPLSEEDTSGVARGTTGQRTLPAELQTLIYRTAEGNPFFIEEVTKSLLETGALVADGAGYALGRPIEQIEVPDTVQGVIMARLDRLDEEPRQALQTASVIGREFTSRLLERTAGAGTSDEALRQLKSVQLIFERSLYPELVFMFKHALTHEVAYGSMLLERRRSLHSAVAEAIRELYADRPAEVVEMLAHHFERAERWSDAVPYLVASADKAMAGFALPEAIAYAGRALVALDRSGDGGDRSLRAHLHHVQGQCHELRNDWGPAIDSYRAMAEAAEEAGDETTLGYGLALVSFAQIYAHELAAGAETAQRARSIALETGDADLVALTLVSILFNRVVSGDLEEPYTQIDELESASRDATDPFVRIFGLDLSGEMHHMRSHEADAAVLLDEALRLAEEAQIAQVLQWVYFDVALAMTALGRYDDALDAARKNVALCDRVGDKGFWLCRAENTLGRIFIEICDFERGAYHNRIAIERGLAFGDRETLRNAQLNLGDCLLGSGDTAAARGLFEELDAAFAADTDPGEWMKWRYTMHLWIGLSQTWLALGEPERALPFAARCLERAEETGTKRYVTKALRARARATSAAGRHDEALEDLTRALAVAEEIGGPEPVWQALAARADVSHAAGRSEEAAAAAASGLALVETIAAGVHERGSAEVLLTSGPVARLRDIAAAPR